MVGAVNTGVDFTAFAVLSYWSTPLFIAQCLSYSCGVLNSFLMNRKWTFRQQSRDGQQGQSAEQLLKFIALNLLTLTLTYVLLVWFHDSWGLPMLLSKLLASGVSFLINFTGSRLWVFGTIQEI